MCGVLCVCVCVFGVSVVCVCIFVHRQALDVSVSSLLSVHFKLY